MLLNHFKYNKLEAGTDEAGRGCLAGPVTAAAVILPVNFKNNILNDSKKLSELKMKQKMLQTFALSINFFYNQRMLILNG